MKKVVLCNISIMLQDNLPNSIDYVKYLRQISENLAWENVEVIPTMPPDLQRPGNNVPMEIPRAIVNSKQGNLQFSPVNLLLTLSSGINNVEDLENPVKAISEAFKEIGDRYSVGYRIGIIINSLEDKSTISNRLDTLLCKNILDKEEWQLSYLDRINEDGTGINIWKHFIGNEKQTSFQYNVDVNTEQSNNMNVRDNNIYDIFKQTLRKVIEGIYNDAN